MDVRAALVGLFDYAGRMATIGERATFRLADYRSLVYHEHALRNRIGISHDLIEGEERTWLRIERLSRKDPPAVPEPIRPWVTVSRDPTRQPNIHTTRLVTITQAEADALVASGRARTADISRALKPRGDIPAEQLRDVVLRLQNDPKAESAVRSYLDGAWAKWAAEEAPRRETIRIYEAFFSLQQAIETQGVERPLELVWGVGVARWLHPIQEIDHPIIEQLVELDVDPRDGAIRVSARSAEPALAIKPYLELSVDGADSLQRFAREYFRGLGPEKEFSPFVKGTFEAILRQAFSLLDPGGRYHPDASDNTDDRNVPAAGPSLTVTDTWVIYARPRSANIIVDDIERLKARIEQTAPENLPAAAKRLVSWPDDSRIGNGSPLPLAFGAGVPVSETARTSDSSESDVFFFPKAFNEEQIAIVRRLEHEDGVVVQGPPGTGKTHTIANIICHYMATGRRVLVVSHGEAALGVLREQIPDEIRELAISLLTSERQGLKLLEKAVALLADDVSQQDPRRLANEIDAGERRVIELKQKIADIETEIRRWAELHLTPLGATKTVLPMDLARRVVEGRAQFAWFEDRPAADKAPQFGEADVAKLREARRKLGADLSYIDVTLPSPNDLPDSATLGAIHEDLASAYKIADRSRTGELPPLSLTVPDAIARAEALLKTLDEVVAAHEAQESEPWLRAVFDLGRDKAVRPEADALRRIHELLEHAVEGRRQYLSIEIAVPEQAIGDDRLLGDLRWALRRQVAGQSAFGFLPLGKRQARAIHSQIRVNGAPVGNADTAKQVLGYLKWRRVLRRLYRSWNRLAPDFGWPAVELEGDTTARWAAEVHVKIAVQLRASRDHLPVAFAELSVLFPFGLQTDDLHGNLVTTRKAREAVALNLSRRRLEASRAKVAAARTKVASGNAPIVKEMRTFLDDVVGSPVPTGSQVVEHWDMLLARLDRLRELQPEFGVVRTVTSQIAIGAPRWAERLRQEPLLDQEDALLPGNWRDAWIWAQQEAYLRRIDGRARLTQLSQERLRATEELERQFRSVVRARTYLALRRSMSDRVRASLVMFATAIRRIGAGTGIKARRFRRDAREAMDSCYSAVPCWIMPTWRVSESLPPVPGSFDLVIIDEASQSDVLALPAILRGRKVLVVGDDKQVSPLAVGVEEKKILQLRHNYLENQPFAAMLLPGSSLYDLMSAVFPGQRIMLKEHFRCVEPIIRFSAREFYENRIKPLRIPKASERLDPPLIDIYVENGVRQGKVNPTEAEVIVEEIERIAADTKLRNRSIGVVSLVGAHQAQRIQSMLLERLGEEAYVRHQIACGDSATFQGKERDIMFVSLVDTPAKHTTKTGLVYQQRFNVALSRARDRMYLVRSIDEKLLKPDDLNARVIRHFKNPMEQAPINAEEAIALCESEFERDVYKELSERSWRVRPQVKAGDYRIDLVVEGAEDRRLAIELDGDSHHGVDQWADDHRRQSTLERMGWRFWRCWASSWTLDRSSCIADLESTLRSMGIEPLGREDRPNHYTEHRVVRRTGTNSIDATSAHTERRGDDAVPAAKAAGVAYSKTAPPVYAAPPVQAIDTFDDESLSVRAGDRVTLIYHDEPNRQRTVTLTSEEQEDDPDMGVIYVKRPLASALLEREEEDVVDVAVGQSIRQATILKIERPALAR